MTAGDWTVILGGVALTGGDVDGAAGCLTVPPDGLGLPPLRTQDVTYPQRDGVRHFNDFYQPRIITLENVLVCTEQCTDCPDVRRRVRDIVNAWKRRCDDTQLIIYPDCTGTAEEMAAERDIYGPFFVTGRPRVAEVRYRRGPTRCASLTLRFDAVDHRINIFLPGGFTDCVTLTPQVTSLCREYPRCYEPDGLCYTIDNGLPGGPVDVDVIGSECVQPIITLNGLLHDPKIENLTTGETIAYSGTIAATDPPVIIDTRTGTASQGGASRTHLLSGSTRMQFPPGVNTLRLISFNTNDSGDAEVCWAPAVIAI